MKKSEEKGTLAAAGASKGVAAAGNRRLSPSITGSESVSTETSLPSA